MGEKRMEFPRQGTSGGWNTYATPQVFPTTTDLHLAWDVPYAPGVLRAVGKRGGRDCATTEVRTAGPAASIRMTVDRDTISTLASGGTRPSGIGTRSPISTPPPASASYFMFDMEMNRSMRVIPSQWITSGINCWKRAS